jgi:flavin reductase (DIM6/NTAB) family NADH-FMN oxidoreductase RutF
MYLSKKDIENTERIKRLNIINSISGVKPANLIGSISKDGIHNLAIFSSVIHLGSNPALLGVIIRPGEKVRRDTYDNIRETGVYTINHIHSDFTEQAHYTSAKFDSDDSEFEKCGLTPALLHDFEAPFVKESPLKIGMRFLEEIPIKANGTRMIIGEVEHLEMPDEALGENDQLDLEVLQTVGISGLNSYYTLSKIASYPYARPHETPDFKKNH